jgi:DhnA family fructose-bisphosphate aldolase class Ia
MNRGGIAGTSFELDDTFTSFTAKRLAKLRCDGGKMMYRLDPTDAASGRTLTACAHAIDDLRKHGLAAFLEPLGVKGMTPAKDAATIIQNCGIAAALGESSAHVWLKIPYCDELDKVCKATTLPILLLVRGAIIGRNLLYPGGDPLPMCRALTALVHQDATLQEAQRLLEA